MNTLQAPDQASPLTHKHCLPVRAHSPGLGTISYPLAVPARAGSMKKKKAFL